MGEAEVECLYCGEPVSIEKARPGPGSYPVHKDCQFKPTETPDGGRHL